MAYTNVQPGKGWLNAIITNLKNLQWTTKKYTITGINGFDFTNCAVYSITNDGHEFWIITGQVAYKGSERKNPGANGDAGTISADCGWPSWQWATWRSYEKSGSFTRMGNKIAFSVATGTLDNTTPVQVLGLIYW